MTVACDDFLRRNRALVSALALLQRSEPGSGGYAEFRGKLEKSVRLVLDTAAELLREALAADTLPDAEVLRQAHQRGLVSGEEAERWRGYFERILPVDGESYDEAALARLRAFVLDARSLEAALRSA